MYLIEQRDEQLLGTQAAIRYHCYFDLVAQHLLRVRMDIDLKGDEEELRLTLPAWAPGSYKIRDYITHVGNLTVCDESSRAIPFEWVAKNTIAIRPGRARSLAVEYVFYANERTVRTMHITRWRAFIFPVNCFFYVEGRTEEIHHVLLYYDRAVWRSLTTALSPVEPLDRQSTPVVLGALNYDILADSPTEIGNHQVRTFDAYGAHHEVALIAPLALNIDWLTERCKMIVMTEASLFGGVPYDRYVFFVYVGTKLSGGLEHARCSVNMCDIAALVEPQQAKSLLALLCHEYFHVWNIKRIRPREYGPFDYTREVHSPMLWLVEGFTSYYDDLFAYRAGFYSREEYLELLARDHLGKLLHVPGRRAMSVRDSSYLAWVKLYAQSPDGHNRFPSYYLKGGVLALLLDWAIIAETKGQRRLDDVMRLLWERYRQQPQLGLREEEVLDVIELVSSSLVRQQFWQWLNGTDDPDIATIIAPFGMEWVVRTDEQALPLQKPQRFLGLQLKAENGRLLVATVEEGFPAWHAGIAVDDEIVAVNNMRVNTPEEFEQHIRYHAGVSTITACCDGMLYSVTVEPPYAERHELCMRPSLSNEQAALLERWLERNV